MQVELYAKFDKDKLLPFLRLCNDIPLQKALDVCDQFQLVEEMIFLLGRMGNIQEALKLITERLQDVNKAIQFAMEQDDEDLWEDLIKYSRTKPKFITGLLNNVGTHIDPTKLIEQIPSQVEIPHLRDSLVKLLQDFSLQIALRVGCKKILVKDRYVSLYIVYAVCSSLCVYVQVCLCVC
ncbi:vacuolar protein sorting-associated protein 41 homolog [Dysidea avara]|uniref:vacuolar protein sorting-associated protein 41 homolog n=1 Tax=Dysidea avara TaxID=196820 RepID=UPI003330CF05